MHYLKKQSFMRFLSFILVLFSSFFFCGISCSQNWFPVVFYNTESLYDTLDGPGTSDDAFTPQGKASWNSARYNRKLDDIVRVLCSMPAGKPAFLIGLCEVESDRVLYDLLKRPGLIGGKYGFVHKDNRNPGELDVALLFSRKYFRFLSSQAIPVHSSSDTDACNRDILYVRGIAFGTDTVHIFVNHWAPGINRKQNNEPLRLFTAGVLRKVTDSLFRMNPRARIIVMGDFYDQPGDTSLLSVLGAGNPCVPEEKKLYNLMFPVVQAGKGSYSVDSEWKMPDQIIVSVPFLQPGKHLFVPSARGEILVHNWMLVYNSKAGDTIPSKTYGGFQYMGGISDHLPVYVLFTNQ